MRVVVDTSVLRQSRGDLAKGDWPALRAAARLGYCTLAIPQVVLQELVDHRRRDLIQLDSLATKAARLRQELFPEPEEDRWTMALESTPEIGHSGTEELCATYGDEVAAWFADSGTMLDDPTVSHSELVDRLLARRLPFSKGERGYRDALIWYSALDCTESGNVILLTANTNDFGQQLGDEFKLADDLVDDLIRRHLPPTQVELVTSTGALLRRILPRWDDSEVARAWASFATSTAGREAFDGWFEARWGFPIPSPPSDAPSWLWDIRLRSITQVDAVSGTQMVDDGDGWYRIHSQVQALGRLSGYAWTWGWNVPAGDGDDFVLWDSWGGVAECYCSETLTDVQLTIAARYRPPIELESLDVVGVQVRAETPTDPTTARLRRVLRSLRCLLTLLMAHGANPDFQRQMFGDDAEEFHDTIHGVLSEWALVADAVPGRYQALAPDNLPMVLADVAGLRALEEQLRNATEAIDAIVSPT